MDIRSGIGGLGEGISRGIRDVAALKSMDTEDQRMKMAQDQLQLSKDEAAQRKEKFSWEKQIWQDENAPGSVEQIKGVFSNPEHASLYEKIGIAKGFIKNPGTPEATISKRDAKELDKYIKETPEMQDEMARRAITYAQKKIAEIDAQLKAPEFNIDQAGMTPEYQALINQKKRYTYEAAKGASHFAVKKNFEKVGPGDTLVETSGTGETYTNPNEKPETTPADVKSFEIQSGLGLKDRGTPEYREKFRQFRKENKQDITLSTGGKTSFEEKKAQSWLAKNPGKTLSDYEEWQATGKGNEKVDPFYSKALQIIQGNPRNMNLSPEVVDQKAKDLAKVIKAKEQPAAATTKPAGGKPTSQEWKTAIKKAGSKLSDTDLDAIYADKYGR